MMIWLRKWIWPIAAAYSLLPTNAQAIDDPPKRRIAILAGPKSHGPVGNGIHDYGWSAKALKVMLDNSSLADKVIVDFYLDGWPQNPDAPENADSIVILSDGRDGELYQEALHLQSPDKIERIANLARRGCGLVTIHFSNFAPDRYAEQVLDWVGGYFDWETDGKRLWYSAIQTANTDVEIPAPDHPIASGVRPFRMNEEFYFNLRFHPLSESITPILNVPALPGREPDGRVVAWARERPGGGRGFGTTCGHFYDNWKNPNFRKLVLNGILWSAHVEIPKDGTQSTFYTREEITTALQAAQSDARAKVDDRPIRVLLFAGNDAHKWHNWEKTTPAICELLSLDKRIQVDVSLDIEDLARKDLDHYHSILLNYANWQDPRALSDAAKTAFTLFLKRGGGLVVVHFANGAFHYSLPDAGQSDWPEYRTIVRRVWNHHGQGDAQSGHDAFGPFRVDITAVQSPLTAGLESFSITDELYFRQDGDQPIEPLLTARSKVTGKDEPLAFAYRYGDGRVFQTLLGHSEQTYVPFEPREILRRAVAWTANRAIRPLTREDDPAAQPSPPARPPVSRNPVVPGRFSNALNGHAATAHAQNRPEYTSGPRTVECWARIDNTDSFNILIACEPKSSNRHWELFTEPATGHLAVYLPGRTPDHVRSTTDICDGTWHYIAVTLQDDSVALYVDAKKIASANIAPHSGQPNPGGLAFATLVERGLGLKGQLDEVRVSQGIRDITTIPDQPFAPDENTVGLWRFDSTRNEQFVDFSNQKNAAELNGGENSPLSNAQQQKDMHYSQQALGFDWTEQDSVDHRWNDTDIGPFLASVVPLPNLPAVQKGLSIKIGPQSEATVLYDTQSMTLRAAWTGGFLRFDPTRFGLISPPTIDGELRYLTEPYAIADSQTVQHNALHLHGDRVLLDYHFGKRRVLETPSLVQASPAPLFLREIEFAPSKTPTRFRLAQFPGEMVLSANQTIATFADDTAIALLSDKASLDPQAPTQLVMTVPASESSIVVRVLLASNADQLQKAIDSPNLKSAFTPDLNPLTQPGSSLWTEEIVTKGVLGDNDDTYAVDQLSLPFDNPYRALLFTSDLDFLSNGDLALCTVHGDVWIVSGVDDRLERLHWNRFATGLFQPLGLRIVDDVIYVLGRDQITRLVDSNGDRYADRYDCFHNSYETSPGGHDYVTCLETDSRGNFYLLHANSGLLRIAPDGSKIETIATGFRNPNGLGVFPDNSITVAPQEGTWTPSSAIVQIQPGGYYGYGGPKITEQRPLGYDPPLCWIPRLHDNSGGSQAWSPATNWGPLQNQPMHLSYGQCRMFLLLREQVGEITQGGVVPLPLSFRSGVMRARANPHDNNLYLCGLKGWVSSAIDDGVLARVRPTGQPGNFPVAIKTLQNGLAVTFSDRLEWETAEDPDRYSIFAWNYRYSDQYGSDDYKPSEPESIGREEWAVASATLSPDAQTVFLEIPNLQPVMQLAIDYHIKSANSRKLDGSIDYTVHAVPTESMPEDQITRRPRPGQLPSEIQSRLALGAHLQFEQSANSDELVARTLAWATPENEPATSRLDAGPFECTANAYLKAPTPAEYQFALQGTGTADLFVNGTPAATNVDLAANTRLPVDLHKNYNRIHLRYRSPRVGPAAFRLLWQSESFAQEPIPPTLLFHDSDAVGLQKAQLDRRAEALWSNLRCRRCHQSGRWDDRDSAPSLDGVGSRLTPSWMAHWLANPHALRPNAEMPAMLTTEGDTKDRIDIVAFLTTLTAAATESKEDQAPDTEKGLALYEDLGCIACHTLHEDTSPDDRISLRHVAAKFQPGQLEAFLLEPHALFATTRMPHFGLTHAQASSLAAYIREDNEPLDPLSLDLSSASAVRGRAAFLKRGCQNCHAISETDTPRAPAVVWSRPDEGCMSDDPPPGVPRFRKSDRATLTPWLAGQPDTTRERTPAEDAAFLLDRLDCIACHAIDDRQAARRKILAEESEIGLPPESVPDLTWAGEKLLASWIRDQLNGHPKTHSRPWLKARMPAYPAYAERLAHGLAAQYGHLADFEGAQHQPDPDLVAVGEALIGARGGLDCVSCHAVGDRMPTGDDRTQISPGINFALIPQRMREEHFLRFVLDPPRFDIATRMPKLAQAGRTKLNTVFEADAARQFHAIWHYIGSLSEQFPAQTKP